MPPATPLSIDVYDGDTTLAPALRRAGFEPRSGARVFGMLRAAKVCRHRVRPDTPFVQLEPTSSTRESRFDRAAWKPAAQPWADGRVVDPQAESPFNGAEYEAVRNAWLYAPNSTSLPSAPIGLSSAVASRAFDPAIGVAEIEPLGVVPEHRRTGLAVAMCHEVAARVSAAGGSSVFINTRTAS